MAGGITGFSFIDLLPIVAIIPPSRWERLSAWLRGVEASSTVIRRIW